MAKRTEAAEEESELAIARFKMEDGDFRVSNAGSNWSRVEDAGLKLRNLNSKFGAWEERESAD